MAAAPELRPTLGRVRETLFNWLQSEVVGARVLDLYAGSGSLGFEALSRGAAQCVFVDSHARVAQALRKAAATLAIDPATIQIQAQPAERWLSRAQAEPFDLVFLDPPFDDAAAHVPGVLRQLQEQGLVKDSGAIYLELPRRTTIAVDTLATRHGLAIVRDKTAGDCRFLLLRVARAGTDDGTDRQVGCGHQGAPIPSAADTGEGGSP